MLKLYPVAVCYVYVFKNGAFEGIRIFGFCLRRAVLYLVELWVRRGLFSKVIC